MLIIPLLFAVLNCTEISENVWECRSDDTGYPPGMEGVHSDPEGNYICTNCVQMSESECLSIKQSILSAVSSSLNSLTSLDSNINSALISVSNQVELFRSFSPCPYSYAMLPSDLAGQPYYDSSISNQAQRNKIFWDKALADWYASTNYSYIGLSIPTPASLATNGAFLPAFNYFVGVWECTYESASHSVVLLEQLLFNDLEPMPHLSRSIRDELIPLQTRANEVTCSSCTLGNVNSGDDVGDEGGGEEGVQTGCLSCYLDRLDDITEILSAIDNNVHSIETKLSTYIDDVKDKIIDSLDIPLSSISNIVGRIDDYLRIDNSAFLSAIKSAVIVVSNEVSTLQRHYYEQFRLADEHKNIDKDDFDLREAVQEVPLGGDSVWSRLNWFSRMEALLAYGVGFGTNATEVATELDSDVLADYDSNMESVRTDSSGSSARDTIQGVFDSLDSAFDALNIFGSISEPTVIRLLDAAELPVHSQNDSMSLTLEVPDIPAIYAFLRFVRYAFVAVYWFAALFGFVFILLKLYGVVVSIIKWSSGFLSNVFSG